MWRREFAFWMTHYRRTWRGTVVMSLANPLLFFTGIGLGLGRLIDRSSTAGLHGATYLAFLAPGLLAAAAMQTGTIESGGPVFQSLHWRGNYRAAAATPLRPADILHGHLVFIAFRVASSAAAVLLIMLCFGTGTSAWVLLCLPAALLTGMAFAVPLMAVGALIRQQNTVFTIFRFVMMPMYLFSGTFVAVSRLPAVIRPLVYPLPLWHGVELCRSLALGPVHWLPFGLHLLYLGTLLAAGYVFARVVYRRRLHA